jgi:hypothetical protein
VIRWWESERAAASSARLGHPGPWQVRRFEVPSDGHGDEDALAAWARSTGRGRVPARWHAPDKEEVERWVPRSALSARAGSHAAQGVLVHEPRRIALRFPLVARVPDDLPAVREEWLRALIADALRRWRMVRIEVADSAVQAEVDLTGAPHESIESLLLVARDALVLVVEWLLAPLALILDSGLESRLLSAGPPRVVEEPEPSL